MVIRHVICALIAFSALVAPGDHEVRAADRFITLASTTSTEQSGFFTHVLPIFETDTGIAVHVVAVGTGQALAVGERGDADALLVHDRSGEEKFVSAGFGIDRRDVMFNDFVIIGPGSDPAKVRGSSNAVEALQRIHRAQSPFASRGDDSGTHRREMKLWKAAGLDPQPAMSWYRSLGQGMGPTLNLAAGLDAYVLADRATWANFRNRQNLELLFEGDPALYNPYSSILVDPAKLPQAKAADASNWHEWITSEHGRKAIESFRIDGAAVFFLPGSKPSSYAGRTFMSCESHDRMTGEGSAALEALRLIAGADPELAGIVVLVVERQSRGERIGVLHRSSDRRPAGGAAIRRQTAGSDNRQRPPGHAAGGGGSRHLSPAVAGRAGGVPRLAVHAGGHGAGANHARHSDRRGAVAPGAVLSVGAIWRRPGHDGRHPAAGSAYSRSPWAIRDW